MSIVEIQESCREFLEKYEAQVDAEIEYLEEQGLVIEWYR